MPASKSTTPAQLAEELGVGQRKIRRMLRAADAGVGRGNRYALSAKQAASIRKQLAS